MATDYYLKLEGVEGESQKEGHTKEIEVADWGWEGRNGGSFAQGSGGGTGRFTASDLNFTVPLSKASPNLLKACAKGAHIDKAILSCRKGGGGDTPYVFLKITLEHCLVSYFSCNGPHQSHHDTQDIGLFDRITLNFSKITYEYFAQDASKGTVSLAGSASYDFTKAKAAS